MQPYLITAAHAVVATAALWIAAATTSDSSRSNSDQHDEFIVRIAGSAAIAEPVKTATRLLPKHSLACEFITSDRDAGIDQLLDESADMVLLTHALTEAQAHRAVELSVTFQSLTIGSGGVAIVVHPTIGRVLNSLTMDQLREIFVAGSLNEWRQVCGLDGKIQVVCPPVESGVSTVFLNALMQNNQARKGLVEQSLLTKSVREVTSIVSRNPLAIGIVWSTVPTDGLATLAIKVDGEFVGCNEQSIRQQRYPFIHDFTVICRKPCHRQTSELLAFFGSVVGQQGLHNAGMVTAMQFAATTYKPLPSD